MKTILTSVLFLSLLSGCAALFKYHPYARNVKKKPGVGGVIALKTEHRQEDKDLAHVMMSRNCGSKKVSITEEGEAVIGTVTQGTKTHHRGNQTENTVFLFGGHDGKENSTSTTLQKKEWRLTYVCK